eukprot:1640020-Amphidinium_carterae.1
MKEPKSPKTNKISIFELYMSFRLELRGGGGGTIFGTYLRPDLKVSEPWDSFHWKGKLDALQC